MQEYKTVEEKAAEWNLSARHVQYLCRNGRIAGAVKHAEVWFIPVGAASPAKKTKPTENAFHYVGTKRAIFYSAIDLFMHDGFDSVSLRDIASKVGIRQSTIYNHFKSKQDILSAIYDFYCHYYLADRPTMEEMRKKLDSDSVAQIIEAIRYDFKKEYVQTMSDISKILFQRIGVDERAREIAETLMLGEGIRYVEEVFSTGIEMGRFAPFDVHTMAVFINSVRIFTLFGWIIDSSPESLTKLFADEHALYAYALAFIKDLKL